MEIAKVVVIILTYNQRDRTLQCLSSLLATKNPSFNIFLWDNGSQDGTVEAVKKTHSEVMVHYHPVNLGVASGRNGAAQLAIKRLNPSHLLFLDNDMNVEPANSSKTAVYG
jgi:GT2 family glycosyltransferase